MSASTTGIMNAVENANRVLFESEDQSRVLVDRVTLEVLTRVAEQRLAQGNNG